MRRRLCISRIDNIYVRFCDSVYQKIVPLGVKTNLLCKYIRLLHNHKTHNIQKMETGGNDTEFPYLDNHYDELKLKEINKCIIFVIIFVMTK